MAQPFGHFLHEKEENETEQLMFVPGQCCKGRPLHGVLSPKNSLAVHGLGDSSNSGEPSGYVGEVVINEVLFRKEYDCRVVRKLINEMSGVFLANQREPERPMTVDEILHYSRSYRAVIKLSIEETQRVLITHTGEEADHFEELMRSLVVSESAWSLAEIIFFQEPRGGELVGQLLLWLQAHINDCQVMLTELLRETHVESHHNYWPAILGCLLQGRLKDAVQLLQSANSLSQSWMNVIDCINKMPLYQTAYSTILDFEMRWQHWQEEVKGKLDQGAFCVKITQIALILVGDLETIRSTVDELSLSWYSYLLAVLLFRHPTARLQHVQDLLGECVSQGGGIESFDTHDHLILSILKRNMIDLMKYSSEGFNSWWFAAHFADVFHKAGYLHEKNSVGTNMRESLILDYGGTLMQHDGLWPVGARYLEHCPDLGIFHLQEYLTRVSLTSTKKALKVLNVCERHGFTQQAASICRVMAKREVNEDRLGSALTWCRHGKDGNMATIVAERFIEGYRQQTHTTTDVLDALGSTMLLMSKNLLFLAKLREFHQLCDLGNEKQACALLVNLISSRMAPSRYWFLLLVELLPMLETSRDLFSTSQIYELMNALCELQQTSSGQKVNVLDPGCVETLQLSLSRCLATAILHEPQVLMGITSE
ncbi:nuclear pore complex protein Nup85-like isoform X2 [Watersipora subatra]|uniref:nuclear pore complex protein Nup85-like isoform X2 n=1 Tax=Watersipora subatra TaxID=2589382 RepID=UPI00355B1659